MRLDQMDDTTIPSAPKSLKLIWHEEHREKARGLCGTMESRTDLRIAKLKTIECTRTFHFALTLELGLRETAT